MAVIPKTIWFLLGFMGIDIVTGVLKSLTGKSEKSNNGKLSSNSMTHGLVKKVIILLLCLACLLAQIVFSIPELFNITVTVFSVSEFISIIENVNASGVKIPAKLKSIIEKVVGNDE